MSNFLYLAIEGKPPGKDGRWRFMQRMPDIGSTGEVHRLFGLEVESEHPDNRLGLRGLPDDVDDETLAEDPFFIDDAIASTDAGDCVDTRFCTLEEAQDWAASGRARLLSAGRVSSPYAFDYSWATTDELGSLLENTTLESGVVSEVREIVDTMRYLEKAGLEVRAIYWFE